MHSGHRILRRDGIDDPAQVRLHASSIDRAVRRQAARGRDSTREDGRQRWLIELEHDLCAGQSTSNLRDMSGRRLGQCLSDVAAGTVITHGPLATTHLHGRGEGPGPGKLRLERSPTTDECSLDAIKVFAEPGARTRHDSSRGISEAPAHGGGLDRHVRGHLGEQRHRAADQVGARTAGR